MPSVALSFTNWVALHVNSVEEFSAGDISSGDSSRDEEHFVRNVSRKALRRIISLKSPPIEFFSPTARKNGILLPIFSIQLNDLRLHQITLV